MMFQPPLANSQYRPPSLSRPMGNAQARNPALAPSPAYGNTTNPNGAQTAASSPVMTGFGQPARPAMPAASPMGPVMPPAQAAAPAPIYPGGDVAGIASYYRNTAQQKYSPQSMNADIAEAAGNRQFMQNNPVAGSSIDASQIASSIPVGLQNPVTARTANSYNGLAGAMNDPNRLTPDMKQQLAQQGVTRRMSGGAAGDPTAAAARFTGNNPLAQNTAEYARGLAGVAAGEGVMIQPGGRGSNQQYLGFNNTRAGAEQAALASAGPKNESVRAKYDDPVLKAKQKAFSEQKAAKAAAFQAENNGMNYKQVDRLERKRERLERMAQKGVISRSEANARYNAAKDVAIRRAGGSKMAGIPGDMRMGEMPQKNRLSRQEPAKAAQSVKVLTEQSPHIKFHGWTESTTPDQFVESVATMDPTKMTPDQKFEAARSYHDFMLSQMETGKQEWQPGETDPNDPLNPRTLLAGLDSIKPGDREAMIQWFESLITRSRQSTKWNRNLGIEYGPSPGFSYDIN